MEGELVNHKAGKRKANEPRCWQCCCEGPARQKVPSAAASCRTKVRLKAGCSITETPQAELHRR